MIFLRACVRACARECARECVRACPGVDNAALRINWQLWTTNEIVNRTDNETILLSPLEGTNSFCRSRDTILIFLSPLFELFIFVALAGHGVGPAAALPVIRGCGHTLLL